MRRLKKAFAILPVLIALIAVAVYFVFQLSEFGGKFTGERLERMNRSPEFIDGRFQNTPLLQHPDSSLLKTYRLYQQGQIRKPQFEVPVIKLVPSSFAALASEGLKAIWFGHSSVLVEIEGVRLMTDPVLSDVVSPVPFIYGPKRIHPPPIALQDLSHIDAVLISHDHYDHLDMKTVEHLASQGTKFFVGLGVGAHLERWGVPAAQIHEMDW